MQNYHQRFFKPHHKKNNQEDIIFGIRPVIEYIKSDKQVDKILIKQGIQSDLYHELMELIKAHNIVYQFVPIEKLNRVTPKNHQGVVAFASPVTFHDITTILPDLFEKGKTPFILILDRITDVRNFGAICRSAECFGVDAIVIPTKETAQINSETAKTSAGAIHHLKICKVNNLTQTVRFLQESGLTVIACSEKGQTNIFELEYQQEPIAIVVGSEFDGISSSILKLANKHVKIPIVGQTDSLNVSVATGIVLYEISKQKIL